MISSKSISSIPLVVSMLVLPPLALQAFAQPRTLQSFGVKMQHGQPVYPLPSNVALGLFDPDPLPDLAYYADACLPERQGKVQVWKNLGDGTFGERPIYEQRVSNSIAKMEWRKSRMLTETIYDKDSWSDLYVTYATGITEKISHEWMKRAGKSFASVPQIPDSYPPLNFVEKWRSEPNPGLGVEVLVGDIDNDRKTEIIHMAYPAVGDSLRKLRVYECVGNDSFAVEWDTTVVTLSGVFWISDLDNDGHKEIVTAYFPRGVSVLPRVALLECFGPGQFRFYDTNIGFQAPIFKVQETDIDHDGVKELTVLTSDLNATQDPTLIYIARYSGKSISSNGWFMSFSPTQLARYRGYTFNLAVGQMDGEGRDEIVPAGGSFGVNEPVPIDYLWYTGIPGPELWRKRQIYTGLQSGSGAVMFANLDADTIKEFISGAPGPIGHGSLFALKYLHDTTWSVMWADSSLRNAPLWVNAGVLSSMNVVAGANTYQPNADTTMSWLHVYQQNGEKLGTWFRDSASIQQFHFANLDNDEYSDLLFAQISIHPPHYLKVFETTQPNFVPGGEGIPFSFLLEQNYPNPFNSTTTIRYTITRSGMVELHIYDMLGKEVKTFVSTHKEAGIHRIEWNGTNDKGGDVGSGVYFFRLVVTGEKGRLYTITKKMVVLR